MRLVITAFVLWFVAVPDARAEWNVFAPCRDAGFSEAELRYLHAADLCDPRILAERHRSFSAGSIATVAGEGGQVVRVTVTDGYGNLTVMVEEVRRAGSSQAIVIARGLGDGGRRPPEVMQASLESDAWDAIARRASEHAHSRALAPLPAWRDPASRSADNEEVTSICVDGWSVMIETFGFGESRVMSRNACDDSADQVFDFGWRTMRYAFAAFNECGFLDQQFFSNDASRLAFCFGLSGEVNIAASAANAVQPYLYDALASERLRHVLADDVVLTLNGEATVAGADAAFARWRSFVAAGEYEMRFDTAIGAEDNEWRESAQLTLLLVDDAWPNEHQARFAEVVQSWRRIDSVWLLQSTQVGPWQTITVTD
ncbi:MAG: hypothetical protein NT015_13435 [Alphaproteobacteria bacterium]|nr:hypothetical protein [Alphaproteobacteria bacterium]